MMDLHIYDTGRQPATAWRDPNLPGRMARRVHRERPHTLRWTMCCRRRRLARYCDVKVFYDGIYTYCREGHGCTVEPKGRMRKCPAHGRCRGCAAWRASR